VVYCFLMGFTNTMIFLRIRKDVNEKQIFDVESVSKLAGIAAQVLNIVSITITITTIIIIFYFILFIDGNGLSNQVSGLIGSSISLLFATTGLYRYTVDQS
jgi:hypothetical protein